MQWKSIVILPHIKSQHVWFYTTLVIEFVLHHRLLYYLSAICAISAILVMKVIPTFKDVQRLLAGLQNQYTGYSYNLAGVASPN